MRPYPSIQASALALLTLAGCASVSKERGHDDVDRLVRERAGHPTRWASGSPEDDQVDRWVDELLAHGLSRGAAVEIALVANPRLQATYESLGVSQADMVQAGLLRNPALGAHVAFPVRGDGKEIQFSLVQDFLDVFVLPLRKQIAREQFTVDVLRVAQEALDTVAAVEKEYAAVQAAAALADYQRTVVTADEGAAALSRAQFAAGNVDALKHANQLASFEESALDLTRDELELLRHREALNRLLGLWGPRADWKLAEALQAPPAAEPPLDALEARAVAQRLDVDAARKEQKLLARAVDLARDTRLVGRLDVGVDAHQDADGPRVFGPSLVIELPIFDQRQATVARLEARERQARHHADAAALEARSEVRLARAELLAARAIVERYQATILPMRDEALDEAQLFYNGMLLGLYQLIETKSAQVMAHAQHIAALRDYWTARADLERAIGGQLVPTTTNAAGGAR
ncbi:MAG TPA: TolC family protein [Polyangia bacterium]|nr:TolC family protein [Polyangia bacterium]